jgi:hypothetical protein
LLFDLLITPEIPLSDKVKSDTSEHLQILPTQLHEHFCIKIQFINAFVRECISLVPNLASKEQDSLTKKFCDISVKPIFTDKLLAAPLSKGPQLADKTVKYPVTFPMIHICHCGLSALIALQSKY